MTGSSPRPQLKLTRFHAQNCKCLRDVSFNLVSRLAVFVGRNNTGKSTILDVFDFIREAAANPGNAIQKRGTSLSDLIWRLADGAPCQITLEFDVPEMLRNEALKWVTSGKQENVVTRLSADEVRSSPFLRRLLYQVSFGPHFVERVKTNGPKSEEITFPLALFGGASLTPYNLQLNALWNYDPALKEPHYFVQSGSHLPSTGTLPKLLFGQQGNEHNSAQFAINWLREFFSLIYHSSPHRKSEESQQIKSVTSIHPDGSNLVQVLHTLHNNDKPRFQKIERDVARLVDGVESLSTPIDVNSTTTLIYQNFGPGGALPFPIKQISAGTIQLLILLTQLHTQPDNGLVILEELETMLHPRAQAEFARILREVTPRLTIMMSTHSSVIASETREDALHLVKKKDGATELQRFTDDIADELVDEMGIRPSYNFESNTVVFVEGKFDEAVYSAWLGRLRFHSSLIDAGGYSNVQFYANARILRRQAVRVEKFAVFDGDTIRKGDAKQAKQLLNLDVDHVLELDELNLEQMLAQPAAIKKAFSTLGQSEQDVARALEGKSPADLKSALNSVLRTVGGYNVNNVAILATCVDPPEKWIKFFQQVDNRERETR
jgi:predicted ATPase